MWTGGWNRTIRCFYRSVILTPGVIFVPWGHLRYLGVLQLWGRGVLPACNGLEARDAIKQPTMYRTAPHNKESSSHRVSTVPRLRNPAPGEITIVLFVPEHNTHAEDARERAVMNIS